MGNERQNNSHENNSNENSTNFTDEDRQAIASTVNKILDLAYFLENQRLDQGSVSVIPFKNELDDQVRSLNRYLTTESEPGSDRWIDEVCSMLNIQLEDLISLGSNQDSSVR